MPHKIQVRNFDFRVSCDALLDEKTKEAFKEKMPFILLSYNALPSINLDDEIDGVSVCLAELVSLSSVCSSTVFCGITTQIMGLKHISVAVCHKGRLIDIVDRTSNLESDRYNSGDKIKIFSTDFGRLAVLVDKDILLEKNWEKVACESDIVVCILKGGNELFRAVAADLSRSFNTPLIYIDDSAICWYDPLLSQLNFL